MSARLFRFEVSETQDDGDLQTLRGLGLSSEEMTVVHKVQQFGLSSHAPVGSHGLGLALHGQRSLVAALGLEHPQSRPRNTEMGGTVLYDMHNNAVSLVQANIRIVHATEIRLVAPSIVLDGTVKVGGDDASHPAAMQGTTDSRGDVATGNLATKVLLK